MACIWIAMVLSVLTTAAARAEMKIVNVQAASRPFWPALEHLVYIQGEDVAFRHQILGDITLRITATDKIRHRSARYEAPLHIGVPE